MGVEPRSPAISARIDLSEQVEEFKQVDFFASNGLINGDAELLGFLLLPSTRLKKTTTLCAIPMVMFSISIKIQQKSSKWFFILEGKVEEGAKQR